MVKGGEIRYVKLQVMGERVIYISEDPQGLRESRKIGPNKQSNEAFENTCIFSGWSKHRHTQDRQSCFHYFQSLLLDSANHHPGSGELNLSVNRDILFTSFFFIFSKPVLRVINRICLFIEEVLISALISSVVPEHKETDYHGCRQDLHNPNQTLPSITIL